MKTQKTPLPASSTTCNPGTIPEPTRAGGCGFMRFTFALVFFVLSSTGTLKAASVIDSFNNISAAFEITNSTPLAFFTSEATASGVGFTTGYQQPTGMVPVFRTNDLLVPINNYVSGQANSPNHWKVGTALGTSARRVSTRLVNELSGTIWFSFIASLDTPKGDLALTFNGTFSGTGQFGAGDGMRVGLGLSALPGAFGVGPVASQATLATINNGVNGVITTNGFIPTDGTPGLVLGRISTDAGSGQRRVDLWYNPDVANEAALPEPILSFTDAAGTIVPWSVTRIGYQVMRATTANEHIDNVKLSDEPNAFDIVYKNAPLPLPILNVTATSGSESGPTNVVFSITLDRPISTALTVEYQLSGVATNGFDGAGFTDADFTDANFNTSTLVSSFTIPAGGTNATVTLVVIDDLVPEGDETITLSISPAADYILGTASATAAIIENNDANVSAQFMFTRTSFPQVWDPNLDVSPMNSAGVGGGYSTTPGLFVSPDASLRARGDFTAANAQDAISNGNFFSFSVSPKPGYAVTITNLQLQAMYGNYLFQEPTAAAAVIFLRSSLDGFASDLATWELQPDTLVFPPWYSLEAPLGSPFGNLPSGVEFRLYVYDDSTQNQVGVRIDDLFIKASTAPAVGVQQVAITEFTAPAEPDIQGSVTITRYGETTNPLTLQYAMSGTAENGVDYVALPGSAVIPSGQTQVVIIISPIDDNLVEPNETVILSILPNPAYAVLAPASASMILLDDGDIGGLVGYLFNEGNNTAATLSAVAVGSTFEPGKVIPANAAAGPGLGNFGANSTAVGHGYATSSPRSAPSSLFMRGDALSLSAGEAFAAGDYVSFSMAPAAGHTLTITNLTAYIKLVAAGQTTWVFLRSSADDFASDISSITIPANLAEEPYTLWSVPLSVFDATTAAEFRMYFYTSRINGSDITRVDDVSFQGFVTGTETVPAISGIEMSGGNVVIQFTGAASDAPSLYKLVSSSSINGSFTEESAAVITGELGVFQATTAPSGAMRFYRILR